MPFTLNAENILLLGSLLIFVSILVSKTGSRFGIPTLLLFLFVGMLVGSDGLGLHFDNPRQAQFVGMVSLSIILFSGGMETRFRDIRPVLLPGIVLSTVGVLLTTALTGCFIYALSVLPGFDLQLSLTAALLLAATMSSTDSASVFSLLRTQGIGLKHRLRPLLELESGSNDPMAYMLTIALTMVAASGNDFGVSSLIRDIAVQFAVGGLLGYACGRLAAWIINRINLANAALYPVLLLSLVFLTFTVTDTLGGNGYLAVYITGLIVGNHRLSYRREMSTFMEGLTWLVQIVMFITLGLLVNPSELPHVAPVAIAIGLFMMFVGRPVAVQLCLLPFRHIPVKARHFLSWVGLRGAVPILFATYPILHDVPEASILFNVVFIITLLSLLVQGTTISKMAKILQLDAPEEKSGNEFGIELPEELPSRLHEYRLTEADFARAAVSTDDKHATCHIANLNLPQGTLVMLIKRGESVIVPNGGLELHPGDILLTITDDESAPPPHLFGEARP